MIIGFSCAEVISLGNQHPTKVNGQWLEEFFVSSVHQTWLQNKPYFRECGNCRPCYNQFFLLLSTRCMHDMWKCMIVTWWSGWLPNLLLSRKYSSVCCWVYYKIVIKCWTLLIKCLIHFSIFSLLLIVCVEVHHSLISTCL